MQVVGNHNLHTLEAYNAPVCVLCKACGHRGTVHGITLRRLGGVTHGNMTPLRHYKYVCTACGSREHELYLTHPPYVPIWLSGHGPPEDTPPAG